MFLAGCGQPKPDITDIPRVQTVEHQIHLAEFANYDEPVATSRDGEVDAQWSMAVKQEATPARADPADYGANSEGEFWRDSIIESKSYVLEAGAGVTTHTHGVVIIATEGITIDGRVNVRNLGAQSGEAGYQTTRAATLALYTGYGDTDPASGEPLLWGAGGLDGCMGGGYVILRAPTITLNGALDAGSDCGQAGIVILEGNTQGNGTITASLVIHRGQTQ